MRDALAAIKAGAEHLDAEHRDLLNDAAPALVVGFAFAEGLAAAGYRIVPELEAPEDE